MEITIQVKQVYGVDTIYPACEKSRIFAKMVGQKTLTLNDLARVRELGYSIKQGVYVKVNGSEQMVTTLEFN